MNFDHEKEIIREKYHLAGFSTRFVDNVIHQFHQKLIDKQAEYELIIPDFLFAEPKKFILVEIPYCISNENTVKRFLGKLQSFGHRKFDIAVKWSTKKIRSLFHLKDKNPHPACKVYEDICSCANHIGAAKIIRIKIKILNQLNTSESFQIINSIGKYFSRHLQTRNYVRSWNHK